MIYLVMIAAMIFPDPLQIITGINDQTRYWNWMWADKWFYLLLALTLYIPNKLPHWSVMLVITWSLISALLAFGWHGFYHEPHMEAAYAFIAILVICEAIKAQKDNLDSLLCGMGLIGMVNAITIIIQTVCGVPHGSRGGIFGNPSISGCFIAFSFAYVPGWARVPALIAILLCGTSQPIGVLGVAIAAYILWTKSKKVAYPGKAPRIKIGFPPVSAIFGVIATISIIVALAIPSVTSKINRSAFDDSGRFAVWKSSMRIWSEHANVWVGTGTGTASTIVPKIQANEEAKHHKPGETFVIDEYRWMHSDWLQILFENGIIGLCLALIAAFFAARGAYIQSDKLFASLMAYFAAMCFNYPLHMPIHAFFGAVLVAASFRERES